jgi:hypothetical protein
LSLPREILGAMETNGNSHVKNKWANFNSHFAR